MATTIEEAKRGERVKVAAFLNTTVLGRGIENKEWPGSIGAINVALSGELSSTIPGCMSQVIGQWISAIQDHMPDRDRNGDLWRLSLPHALHTGRDPELEKRRVQFLVDWMFMDVLWWLKDVAVEEGFGNDWKVMCSAHPYQEDLCRQAREAADTRRQMAASFMDYQTYWQMEDMVIIADHAASIVSERLAKDPAYQAGQVGLQGARVARAALPAMWKDVWNQFQPGRVLKRLTEME